jgi:N-acetylglucosamine-6-phosphate deacetylase
MNEWMNRDLGGAHLLGIHLEGPFINSKRKGGLDPRSIYPSSPAELEKIYEAAGSSLKIMTIAPELPGNLDVIRLLNQHGTIPSFAHSDATYDETKEGFKAGIRHVTHIFNAMPSLHHRNPGPITAIFEHPWITAQIISDGNHLHPAIINLIYKNIGAQRSICITDGVQGMGLPDGLYLYNGKEYESKEGAARYLDGTLIGTTMSLSKIALKYKNFTGCSFAEALDTVTIVPAKLLGIDNYKGSIAKGKDADLVILNDDFTVASTIVSGKVVYQKSESI